MQLELLLPGKIGLMENNLKVVFWGTPDFAIPALKSLINFGYHIEAVVTQPEKPVGRAKVILPSPVKKFALENNIKVFEPHSLKKDPAPNLSAGRHSEKGRVWGGAGEEFFKQFKHLNPDLCIVAAYGKIIPSRYLDIPKYGFINIHPSLLPKYRGPSPIQTAILNGDSETGVTIMKVDEEVDHGPTLSFVKHSVSNKTYYKEVVNDLAKIGAKLLIETIPKYLNGEIKPREQDHSQATFTKMFERADGKIDWNKPAETIYNQIRALNPEPGTWTLLRQSFAQVYGTAKQGFGGQSKVLNIKKAELLSQPTNELEPGTIIKMNKKVAVKTATSYLILGTLQLEGGKEMNAESFFNGHPNFTSLY